MVLRSLRTAFILAGFALVVATAGDVHSIFVRANLTGQGSTLPPNEQLREMSTADIRLHLSAPELAKRAVSGQIALGTIFLMIGFGLHAFIVRRRKREEERAVEDSEQSRRVKVHAAPAYPGRDKRKMDRWFLWMTVKM